MQAKPALLESSSIQEEAVVHSPILFKSHSHSEQFHRLRICLGSWVQNSQGHKAMRSIKKAKFGEKSEIFLSDQLIYLENQVSFQSHSFSSKKLLINIFC